MHNKSAILYQYETRRRVGSIQGQFSVDFLVIVLIFGSFKIKSKEIYQHLVSLDFFYYSTDLVYLMRHFPFLFVIVVFISLCFAYILISLLYCDSKVFYQ